MSKINIPGVIIDLGKKAVKKPDQKFKALQHLHKRAVKSLQFTEMDGTPTVISGGEDTVINVWNMNTRQVFRTLRGHGSQVMSCRLGYGLDKRESIILSASLDATTRLWDVSHYEEFRVLDSEFSDHEGTVHAAVFDPNASGRIVTGGGNLGGTVSVRTMAKDDNAQASRTSTQSGSDLFRANFAAALRDGPNASPDAIPLLLTAEIGIARLWHLTKGTQVARLTGLGFGNVRAPVAVSGNQQWILTGTNGPGAKLWNVEDVLAANVATVFKELKDPDPKSEVSACAISQDGKIGLTGDNRGVCRLWNLETGEILKTVSHGDSHIADVKLFHDGSFLTAHGSDIRRWQPNSDSRQTLSSHPGSIEAMELSPDEKHILSIWSGKTAEEKMVAVWDIATAKFAFDQVVPFASSGKFHPTKPKFLVACNTSKADVHPVRQFEIPDDSGFVKPTEDVVQAGAVNEVNFSTYSSDGRFVFTIRDKVVRMRDVVTGNEVRRFQAPKSVNSVGFSGDGKFVITGNGDGSVRILNPENGKEIHKHADLPGSIRVAQFRPLLNQYQFVTNRKDDSSAVHAWNPENETITEVAKLPAATHVAYATDGSGLLTVDEGRTIVLRDADDPSKVLKSMPVEAGWTVTSVAYFRGAAGRMIGIGLKNNRAVKGLIWWPDSMAGAPEKTVLLEGHADAIQSIAFAKDGSRAVTGSADRTVKVWDPLSGRELLTLKGHVGAVNSVDFSYDGNTVMSAGEDGKVMLWFASAETP